MENNESGVPVYGAPRPANESNGPLFGAAPPVPADKHPRVLASANWFFWIAALSVINSVIAHSGGRYHFIMGLGATEVVDVVMARFGGGGVALALGFDLLIATIFVGFGLFARRALLWAFVVGMAVYALDGLLYLLVGDWFGMLFHAYALYCIFLGFNVLRQNRRIALA